MPRGDWPLGHGRGLAASRAGRQGLGAGSTRVHARVRGLRLSPRPPPSRRGVERGAPAPRLPAEEAVLGPTVPPCRPCIEGERCRWASVTRALPKVAPAIFERLVDGAKLHIQAGVTGSRPWPCETIVMAVLLEQEKRIERLWQWPGGEQARGGH
jgi:hypothetical protein